MEYWMSTSVTLIMEYWMPIGITVLLDSKGYHNPVIIIGCLYVRTVWGCESIMN
jgi:hypothetical protein